MDLLDKIDILIPGGYNGGNLNSEVAIMADGKRNYVREAETAKARGEKNIVIKVKQSVFNDFTQKCMDSGTNKNAVLKHYIERYTYEGFDQ